MRWKHVVLEENHSVLELMCLLLIKIPVLLLMRLQTCLHQMVMQIMWYFQIIFFSLHNWNCVGWVTTGELNSVLNNLFLHLQVAKWRIFIILSQKSFKQFKRVFSKPLQWNFCLITFNLAAVVALSIHDSGRKEFSSNLCLPLYSVCVNQVATHFFLVNDLQP